MTSKINKWKASETVTAVYLLAVLVGLPLVVYNAYYDITYVKYYYYCGVSALLIPVALLKIREGISVKDFFHSLTLAEKALLIYWVVSGLSTLFSPYRYEAFWGNEGRFSGLFLMTIYVIAYFLVTRCCRPHPVYTYAAVVTGCLVFAIGVTDFFKMDIFSFKEIIRQDQYDRFISTIGNTNFYTSYAGIIAGAAAAIFTVWPERKGAAVWFLLMTVSFAGLIVGNSDNAYLSLGVLVAFLPLYIFKDRKGIRRYFMMLSSLLLAFFVYGVCCRHFVGIVQNPQGVHGVIVRWGGFSKLCIAFWAVTAVICAADLKLGDKSGYKGGKIRIVWGIFLILAAAGILTILIDANFLGHAGRYSALREFVVFNDDWGTHRGFAWRKALENYGNFPLMQKIFGHGPDTFGIISYFRDLSESTALYGEMFDSAHNEYLQFFVTIGPIGAAAYIMFLVLSLKDMLKSYCSPYLTGMAFGVFCYCTQAVVNINQPTSTPIMWAFLAMGIAEYRRCAADRKKKTEGKEQKNIG